MNGSTYIFLEVYSDTSCDTLEHIYGFLVTGDCTAFYGEGVDMWWADYTKSYLKDDGTAAIDFYEYETSDNQTYGDPFCSPANLSVPTKVSKTELEQHACVSINANLSFPYDGLSSKWYSSNDDAVSTGSNSSRSGSVGDLRAAGDSALSNKTEPKAGRGLSTSVIVGAIAGGFVAVAVIAAFVLRWQKNIPKEYRSTANSDSTSVDDQSAPWKDDLIVAKRVSRDRVKVKKLISRGAFGEVYTGTFSRKPVAIKMLLPATRTSMTHVNNFFTEAKLTASMDHPHVIAFVGIAWDSLSDVCVILEFMNGGDLRSLLDIYQTSKHPEGFDKQKAAIALHVCHALTYLHSLMPPVIHRDLKSRNILLDQNLKAKLTDFGASREKLDRTMTAGVGTSLWMAPEVMLGKKYDDKADMFPFGVVLSEMDTHSLLYTQTKQRALSEEGRQLMDANLLQKIAGGSVQVEFSTSSPQSIVELGYACVSVNPNERPSAAEALYRLQVILSQGLP